MRQKSERRCNQRGRVEGRVGAPPFFRAREASPFVAGGVVSRRRVTSRKESDRDWSGAFWGRDCDEEGGDGACTASWSGNNERYGLSFFSTEPKKVRRRYTVGRIGKKREKRTEKRERERERGKPPVESFRSRGGTTTAAKERQVKRVVGPALRWEPVQCVIPTRHVPPVCPCRVLLPDVVPTRVCVVASCYLDAHGRSFISIEMFLRMCGLVSMINLHRVPLCRFLLDLTGFGRELLAFTSLTFDSIDLIGCYWVVPIVSISLNSIRIQ